MVLRQHVQERVTLCVGDSHQGPTDLGREPRMRSILAGLAEQAVDGRLLGRCLGVEDLLVVFDGRLDIDGPGRTLDHYVEARVHGGIELAADVEAIVVDPSFRDTEISADLELSARRYGFKLEWHVGSALHVADVPADFRGPTMPALARQVAGSHDIVDAHRIGASASMIQPTPPLPEGDSDDSPAQQLKYLWHTVLAHGTDVAPKC